MAPVPEAGRARRGMDRAAASLLSATGVLLAVVLCAAVAVALTCGIVLSKEHGKMCD